MKVCHAGICIKCACMHAGSVFCICMKSARMHAGSGHKRRLLVVGLIPDVGVARLHRSHVDTECVRFLNTSFMAHNNQVVGHVADYFTSLSLTLGLWAPSVCISLLVQTLRF